MSMHEATTVLREKPVKPERGLTSTMSTYLDILRLAAALAVFVGHSRDLVAQRLPALIASHQGEAVAVFFVLSGLVISFVRHEKEHNGFDYGAARLSRLYSVCIPALLVTFALDLIGKAVSPDAYPGYGFYHRESWQALFSDLTFTNELWGRHAVFGSDEAYWSLGFEATYYLAFGLMTFLPRSWGIPATLLLMVAAGPKVVLYLPLWLIGVLTYRWLAANRFVMGRKVAIILSIMSVLLYGVMKKLIANLATPIYEWHGVSKESISFLYFHAVGVLVAINILAVNVVVRHYGLTFSAGVRRFVRWTAGASFTLYLVHLPLLAFVRALVPQAATSTATGLATMAVVLVAVLLLAECGERRKALFSAVVRRLMGTIFQVPSRVEPAVVRHARN